MVKKILFLLLLSVFAILDIAEATHLVGGSLTYTYIGKAGQDYEYSVKVTMYRDCKDPNDPGAAVPFDKTIQVGFYENKGNNPRVRTLTIALLTEKNIIPPASNVSCTLPTPKCINEGIYEGTIVLPASNYGYHIDYKRCCRNTLVNLPAEEGQTYYGFIPPTNIINSTPDFTEVPAAFICAKDAAYIQNAAKDPDGDSLVYSLVWPYAGGDRNDPMPIPGPVFSGLPLVQYNFGFSSSQPFGNNGYAKIDPVTGVTTLLSPTTGNFAIAYDVSEYRKGKLLNKVRRDVQIIVISCPYNEPPKPTSSINDTATIKLDYTIIGGEILQFNIAVNSSDTVYMTKTGDIFDPKSNIPKPKATLPDTGGNKSLLSTFRWDTDCSHVRPQPYYFTLKVSDIGCPPKTIFKDFKITVIPFKGADTIFGPAAICENSWAIYAVKPKQQGSTIVWKVDGGVFGPSTQDPNSVQVQWGKSAAAKIKAVEVSKEGCAADTITLPVTINPIPGKPAITGSQNVCLNLVDNYSLISVTPGSQYFWNITGGKQVSGGNSGTITIQWNSVEDTAYISVVEKNTYGCVSDTSSMMVIKSPPKVDKIYGSLSVCPHSKNIDYWVDKNLGPNSTFFWEVKGGTIIPGATTDAIKIDWGGKDTGVINVVEVTKHGCRGDTIILNVIIDYKLITPPIEGDSSVCELSKGQEYKVLYTNNSTYSWQISGGTIVSGNGTNAIIVDWDAAGSGLLTVTQTAYDSVNNLPCTGLPVSMFVSINPLPQQAVINGPLSVCAGDSAVYNVTGLAGSRYIWNINGNTQIILNDSSENFSVRFPGAGNFTVAVFEISKDSCTGFPSSIQVVVNPLPKTSAISGPVTICVPQLNGHIYSVAGTPNSMYQWQVDGGVIAEGQLSNQISVNWLISGKGQIKVQETNSAGCKGDTVELAVNVDAATINIKKVSTLVADDGIIELDWSVSNNSFFKGEFQIFREVAGSNDWKLIGSMPYNQMHYTDKNIDTRKFSYRYRIEAPNICGNNVASVPHRSILLQGYQPFDSMMHIAWNDYEGWDPGVGSYLVYRKNNNDTGYRFAVRLNENNYEFGTGLEAFRQCFRVVAEQNINTINESWSNEYCFEFEPILVMPNVFTPNGDTLNNWFNVMASFYSSFDIKIFDRWGEEVFHSDNARIQWDGTYKGRKAEDGVYLYVISVKGLRNPIYKSGTFHLMK